MSLRRPVSAAMLTAIFVAVMVPNESTAAAPISKDAQAVVDKVHYAAEVADFTTLRSLMVKEFIWSFGGDSDADQAIDEWRKDPRYLKSLAQVTGQKCKYNRDGFVECPAKAGIKFRAGFQRVPAGWRMAYFVEGD